MTKSPSKNHPWRKFVMLKRDQSTIDWYGVKHEKRKQSLLPKRNYNYLSQTEIGNRAEIGEN